MSFSIWMVERDAINDKFPYFSPTHLSHFSPWFSTENSWNSIKRLNTSRKAIRVSQGKKLLKSLAKSNQLVMNSAINFERTVAIIKPHAFHHRFIITRLILSAGFTILKVSIPEMNFFYWFSHSIWYFYRGVMSKWILSKRKYFSNVCQVMTKFPVNSQRGLRVQWLCFAWAKKMRLRCGKVSWGQRIAMKRGSALPWASEHCSVQPVMKRMSRMLFTAQTLCVTHNENCDSFSLTVSMLLNNILAKWHLKVIISPPLSLADSVNPDIESCGDENIQNYLERAILPSLVSALVEMLKVKPANPLDFIANHILDHDINQPTMMEAKQLQFDQKKDENEGKVIEVSEKKANCGCLMSSSVSSISSLWLPLFQYRFLLSQKNIFQINFITLSRLARKCIHTRTLIFIVGKKISENFSHFFSLSQIDWV